MRILFLCGSLEPGRDGVGDYVRCLCKELSRSRIEVAAIAMNDHHTTRAIKDENESIPIRRVPSFLSIRKRIQAVREWIEIFNPDWLSIQFVPYAFNRFGLPAALAIHLPSLLKERKVHMMFHETWIEVNGKWNWICKIVSFLQRTIIIQIIKWTNPRVISTHIPLNHYRLGKAGWPIHNLPVFSNIQPEIGVCKNETPDTFRIGLFSQIDSSSPILRFLDQIAEQAIATGLTVEVLLIGGLQEKNLSFIAKTAASKFTVRSMGFLSSTQVSKIIQSCHLGLTPVPRHLLGKSGSVAAFLTHGIPVAAPIIGYGKDPRSIGFYSEILTRAILLTPDLQELQTVSIASSESIKEINLTEVSQAFLSLLRE